MINSYEDFLSIIFEIDTDVSLLKQAQEYSAKLAKRANVRMKALEDAGFESSDAYARAKGWLSQDDRRRFSESKKLDAESLRAQVYELTVFLQGGSTIRAEKDRRSGLDKLMPNATRKEKNEMRRFLLSAAFDEMKKTIGTNIVNRAADSIQGGASVRELNKLYKQFLDQENKGNQYMDITDVWTLWIGK